MCYALKIRRLRSIDLIMSFQGINTLQYYIQVFRRDSPILSSQKVWNAAKQSQHLLSRDANTQVHISHCYRNNEISRRTDLHERSHLLHASSRSDRRG